MKQYCGEGVEYGRGTVVGVCRSYMQRGIMCLDLGLGSW
jgi:hypothetical protein